MKRERSIPFDNQPRGTNSRSLLLRSALNERHSTYCCSSVGNKGQMDTSKFKIGHPTTTNKNSMIIILYMSHSISPFAIHSNPSLPFAAALLSWCPPPELEHPHPLRPTNREKDHKNQQTIKTTIIKPSANKSNIYILLMHIIELLHYFFAPLSFCLLPVFSILSSVNGIVCLCEHIWSAAFLSPLSSFPIHTYIPFYSFILHQLVFVVVVAAIAVAATLFCAVNV